MFTSAAFWDLTEGDNSKPLVDMDPSAEHEKKLLLGPQVVLKRGH